MTFKHIILGYYFAKFVATTWQLRVLPTIFYSWQQYYILTCVVQGGAHTKQTKTLTGLTLLALSIFATQWWECFSTQWVNWYKYELSTQTLMLAERQQFTEE